jgi:hypothetical protein
MKFKNKITGVIVKVTNEFVLEQMKKSTDYEEVKEIKKEFSKSEKEVEKKEK